MKPLNPWVLEVGTYPGRLVDGKLPLRLFNHHTGEIQLLELGVEEFNVIHTVGIGRITKVADLFEKDDAIPGGGTSISALDDLIGYEETERGGD